MTNLMTKRADPADAAAALVAEIAAILPNAGVTTRTIGRPEQRSLLGAIGHELGGWLRSTEPGIFGVTADVSSPRPLRLHAHYVAVGRGAGPSSILYLTRLRHVIPGPAAFERGRFRSGSFTGDPEVAGPLAAARDLGSVLWRLLQPHVVYGSAVLTTDPFAELLPDVDGAFFGALSAPARATLGLGGYRLDLGRFLDAADRIDAALAGAPGIMPAPVLNVPLPA